MVVVAAEVGLVAAPAAAAADAVVVVVAVIGRGCGDNGSSGGTMFAGIGLQPLLLLLAVVQARAVMWIRTKIMFSSSRLPRTG